MEENKEVLKAKNRLPQELEGVNQILYLEICKGGIKQDLNAFSNLCNALSYPDGGSFINLIFGSNSGLKDKVRMYPTEDYRSNIEDT